RYLERLGCRKIPGIRPRPDKRIARRVAVLQYRADERRRIEPHVGSLVCDTEALAGNQIGPLPKTVVILAIAALRNVERQALGEGENPTDRQPAQPSARSSFQFLADRHPPDETDSHAWALVETARPALGLAGRAGIWADATAGIDGLSGV